MLDQRSSTNGNGNGHTNGNGNGHTNGNGNGHTNGNGNGKEKAFILAQPKSPEQIAREETLSTMPKLRRECSRDARLKRCVGAKWLFGQISDLTFLHSHGGDGFGRIYISIKDLKRIFGHDEGTLALWRDKLIETGWIWFRDMWPKSCWGITGVCRQPELFPPNSEFIQQVVKGEETEERGNGNLTSGLSFSAKNAESGPSKGISPGANGEVSHSPLAGGQRCVGDSPAVCGKLTGQKAGESPAVYGRDSHLPPGDSPLSAGRSRVGALAGRQHIKESLGSIGGLEGNQGVPPAPQSDSEAAFKSWERRLDDMRNSDIRVLEKTFSGQLQSVRDEAARALVKRKLAAVRLRLNGPTLPDAPKPARVAKPGPAKVRLTDEQRDALAGSIGKAMRQAVATAGAR